MRVFDVFVNDQKLCRAGVGRDGVLDTIVSWVKLTGQAAAEARRRNAPIEELRLHVGGLNRNTHHRWAQRALRVGDRISVTVGSGRSPDKPAYSKVDDPRVREERERQYYERLKQKFEADSIRKSHPARSQDRPRRAKSPAHAETQFLNVDLDIWSHAPLDRLVAAFGRKAIVLHTGKEGKQYAAHLELASSARGADGTILRFTAIVESLPRSSRAIWRQARVRQFNVGVQAGSAPHAYELRLRPSTVEAAGRVGAQIAFTVYANERDV
jgi:hypothetical protein